MRKILCIFLCLCCFVGILGCSASKNTSEESITVYFKREKPVYGTMDGVIAQTTLDVAGDEDAHAYLLNQYLAATPDEGFTSPFPNGVSLVSFKQDGLTAKVVLSDPLASLSGMDLTIALVCLTQTILSITGCHEVIISAASKQLDSQNFITLNRDSYLLLDDSGSAQ